MRLFALIFFACAILFAAPPPFDLAELEKKPPSRARDFASLLFLRSDASIERKRVAFYSLRSPKPPHFSAFSAGNKAVSKLARCRNIENARLINADAACLSIALSAARAESLSSADCLKIAQKVEAIDPFKAAVFKAAAARNPLGAAVGDLDVFYSIALGASGAFLKKQSDFYFAPEAIGKLQTDARFSALLERLAQLDGSSQLLESFGVADESKLDFKGAFYLGVIRVMRGDTPNAVKAFESAEAKAATRYEKDRALFWLRLTTKNDIYLYRLYSSAEINFYTLYTRLANDRPLPTIATIAPATKTMEATYDDKLLFDPFFWGELSKKIADRDVKALQAELNKLGHKNAEPYRAAINYALAPPDRAPIYYLNPYSEAFSNLSVDELAMTLAIMRQESRYIPAALSSSYAVGSMQMMPFLIEAMTKERKDKNDVWNFFSPYRQAPYAIRHIKWLRGKLNNPLFVAYAYNGGLGFATRTITSHRLFQKGEFEPFLSMERMPLEEPREYGKSVLTNYAIYRRLFGAPIAIDSIFETK